MSTADIPLGPAVPARCAAHPEVEATGTCARCGTFFCAGCVRQVFGKAWCATCAARPEVHYLEDFRAKLWGKRDGSAWMALVVGVGFGVAALARLLQPGLPVVPTVAFLVCMAAGVCFFLGLRWAREAFIAVPVLFGLACVLRRSEGIGAFLMFLGVASLPVYFDTRNQLFFRRPVSRKRLERLWHVRENNPMARRALSLGAGALLLPVLAPLAVICGVVGLRRVDPGAVPPVGRKADAIAAIVLGVLVMGVWAAILVPLVSAKVGLSLGK
ncbi:hypothetical protein [Hyalangium minutum]|uniref:Uncharacterized protein n=1 Tax=Hyalangium minutum TaxID=394096 RepID=A0A085WLI0_9BACT|nr:hypothetical protein [Hyalangium minutum]KFE68543.1 hypothetical protein DB31_7780 [Hyalangium minutum]